VRPPPFELERYFARHEFAVACLLGSSDVEAFSLAELLELADERGRRLWEDLSLGFTEPPGAPFLREAIAALYEDVDSDDVHDDLQQRAQRGALVHRPGSGGPHRRALARSSTPTYRCSTTSSSGAPSSSTGCARTRARSGFPRLLSEEPIERFCEELARDADVLLVPGSIYGHGGNHFRVGFGRRNLPEAIQRLDRFIDGRPRAGSRAA
jgi:hypothetical protein